MDGHLASAWHRAPVALCHRGGRRDRVKTGRSAVRDPWSSDVAPGGAREVMARVPMGASQRLGRLEQRRCEYRAEEKAGHVSRVGPNGTLVVIPLG